MQLKYYFAALYSPAKLHIDDEAIFCPRIWFGCDITCLDIVELIGLIFASSSLRGC